MTTPVFNQFFDAIFAPRNRWSVQSPCVGSRSWSFGTITIRAAYMVTK